MMLSCEQVLQEIWAYLDKDYKDMSKIKEHLDLCRSCFSRVDFERLLRESMKKKTDCTCPEKARKRIQSILDQF